jgi:hypothetical protein
MNIIFTPEEKELIETYAKTALDLLNELLAQLKKEHKK